MVNYRCAVLFLVVLQVAIQSATAYITKEDVSKCIETTKKILLNQQNSTTNRFNELKLRKTEDTKQYQEKKIVSLATSIRKERGVLSTLKQSATEDHYNVSSCNDSIAIFDLIQNSFDANTAEIVAEFTITLNTNYTQNVYLVNQFAQNYTQLEKKLDKCGKNETKCYEKVQDDCDDLSTQDDMENLESKFSKASERMYEVFTSKIDNLYQAKTKEISNYSQRLKDCFKAVKALETSSKKSDAFSINPFNCFMIIPLLFSVLAY